MLCQIYLWPLDIDLCSGITLNTSPYSLYCIVLLPYRFIYFMVWYERCVIQIWPIQTFRWMLHLRTIALKDQWSVEQTSCWAVAYCKVLYTKLSCLHTICCVQPANCSPVLASMRAGKRFTRFNIKLGVHLTAESESHNNNYYVVTAPYLCYLLNNYYNFHSHSQVDIQLTDRK